MKNSNSFNIKMRYTVCCCKWVINQTSPKKKKKEECTCISLCQLSILCCVWPVFLFMDSIAAKPLCDLNPNVGQKGKIVNIPPAPLHHCQQLSAAIGPLGSCGRGQGNFVLLVITLPSISLNVCLLRSITQPEFFLLWLWIVIDLVIGMPVLLAY